VVNPTIDVKCPYCENEFQLPVGEVLSPLVNAEIERRLDAERQDIINQTRESTAKESDERNLSILATKDKLIADMRVQIEELRRKADSGSQQLTGEVQELRLESMLKTAFPADRIVPVEKGRPGGDIIHEVVGSNGAAVGAILWESKNTRTWSNEWLTKAKQDMRAAKAAMTVIATATLPKGVDIFDKVESVFVVSLRCVLPLAQVLRQVLLDIAAIRASGNHGDGAMDRVLSYLTGQQFRNRVMAIVEGCIALQDDLDADKRATARRWARNQQHIESMVQNTGGMYGDLQGLLGEALQGVPGLALEGEQQAPSGDLRNGGTTNDFTVLLPHRRKTGQR
jgi:hypothetical protein